jgi:hypothetical protein
MLPNEVAESLLIPDTEPALAGVCRSTWHCLRAAGKLPLCVRLSRKPVSTEGCSDE